MYFSRNFLLFSLFVFSFSLWANAPIILPNSPGKDSIEIDQQRAISIANTSYNLQDVIFLQMMILHHEQALVLSRLVPSRTNTENIVDLASRIDSSQEDEILFMKSWLEERGETSTDHHNHQ